MIEEIVIRIAPDGRTAECLYTEAIDLTRLGAIADIHRASDVRWSAEHRGWVIEEPGPSLMRHVVRGDVLVFPTRSAAIACEIRVLNHRLAHRDPARRSCTTCQSQTQTR